MQLQAQLHALQDQMMSEKSVRLKEATTAPTLIANAPAYNASQRLAQKILGQDGTPMMIIPEGHSTMGSKDFRNERPVHQVVLDNIDLDQHEVSASQYADFIKKSGAELPAYWIDLNLHAVSQHPVV